MTSRFIFGISRHHPPAKEKYTMVIPLLMRAILSPNPLKRKGAAYQREKYIYYIPTPEAYGVYKPQCLSLSLFNVFRRMRLASQFSVSFLDLSQFFHRSPITSIESGLKAQGQPLIDCAVQSTKFIDCIVYEVPWTIGFRTTRMIFYTNRLFVIIIIIIIMTRYFNSSRGRIR